jgi:hypothetical protein
VRKKTSKPHKQPAAIVGFEATLLGCCRQTPQGLTCPAKFGKRSPQAGIAIPPGRPGLNKSGRPSSRRVTGF